MKKIKRISAIVIALVMLISLTSCSLVNSSETDITNDNIKIGVILEGTQDDLTGNTGICNSTIKDLTDLGYGIKNERFKFVENVDPADADAVAAAYKSLVNFECNMIIASDPAYMDGTVNVADKTPNVAFFVLGAQGNGKNVFGFDAKNAGAAYLEGIVAGLKAAELKVPKIGYILADANDFSTINAFAKGAKSINSSAEISAVVAGDDIAANTDSLIKSGCVVIASDIQSEEIAKTATNANIFFCDYGTEQFNTDDYSAAYLCTPVINFTQYFVNTIKTIVDFEVPEDTDASTSSLELITSQGLISDYNGGFATGATYLSDISANAASGTKEAVKAVSETLTNGSLNLDINVSELDAGVSLVK